MTFLMSENFEDRYEDGISLDFNSLSDVTISGGESSDTIHAYGANDILGGFGMIYGSQSSDTISFDTGKNKTELDFKNVNGFWKYNEDKILKEIKEYLGSTYKSHYTSQESKTQTLDLIESIGDAEPFCRSNAIKYLSRFGKKNGKSKMDILKAIHYCILLYHFAGLCNENSQPYETF
jgi:hypothetical protein